MSCILPNDYNYIKDLQKAIYGKVVLVNHIRSQIITNSLAFDSFVHKLIQGNVHHLI